MIVIEQGRDKLPSDFGLLRAEARDERFRMIERLLDEWATGRIRFREDGEALLAARVGRVLAGVGGLTRDPVLPHALRMRRFYVRPGFRALGVGRALAMNLLDQAIRCRRLVTVNAATPDAPTFWQALGFTPDLRDGHTHVWS